jgi:hypothetical protein
MQQEQEYLCIVQSRLVSPLCHVLQTFSQLYRQELIESTKRVWSAFVICHIACCHECKFSLGQYLFLKLPTLANIRIDIEPPLGIQWYALSSFLNLARLELLHDDAFLLLQLL